MGPLGPLHKKWDAIGPHDLVNTPALLFDTQFLPSIKDHVLTKPVGVNLFVDLAGLSKSKQKQARRYVESLLADNDIPVNLRNREITIVGDLSLIHI